MGIIPIIPTSNIREKCRDVKNFGKDDKMIKQQGRQGTQALSLQFGPVHSTPGNV